MNPRKLRAHRELNPRNFYGSQLFTFTRLFEILSFNLLIILLMTLVKHSGFHTKIHPKYCFAEWKPLLWYVKGERVNNLVISNTIGDYIKSIPPSKLLHNWEQSTVEAEHIIKNLTLENQTVLDPMMGTGTTWMTALKLNRKFIGIEKDNETFEIAKSRISN